MGQQTNDDFRDLVKAELKNIRDLYEEKITNISNAYTKSYENMSKEMKEGFLSINTKLDELFQAGKATDKIIYDIKTEQSVSREREKERDRRIDQLEKDIDELSSLKWVAKNPKISIVVLAIIVGYLIIMVTKSTPWTLHNESNKNKTEQVTNK